MSILEKIIRVIAPHTCVGCGTEGPLLCEACARRLPSVLPRCYRCARTSDNFRTCPSCRARSPLYQVWVATPYVGQAKALIHTLKFERAQAAAPDVAKTIAATLPTGSDWLVTHVPTATTRVRSRGYDQAQLIAREVAKYLSCPYLPLLARSGQERQVGRNRAQRQQQLSARFRALQPRVQPGMHVLLIDDVLTTGATFEACATVLRASGVRRVSAAAFAAA